MAFTHLDPDSDEYRSLCKGAGFVTPSTETIRRPYLTRTPACAAVAPPTCVARAHEAVLNAAEGAERVPYSETDRSAYWRAVGRREGLLQAARLIALERAKGD